ncbi:MAG: glycosyltransferase [Acidobacteria bacterium]|nr:MAG: glycosyltransferase [Acidobacteriota bacterium]GIK76706.1 MAG: hypothetical protein BroJett022_03960 [Actinomycetes bacterium]
MRQTRATRSLDLIVVHHSDAASTRECVAYELAQLSRLEAVGPARVTVVDNGPTGELDNLEQSGGVVVLPAPCRQGFGANATLAARASPAELLLLLNDDARIDAASIDALVTVLDDPGVAAAGPRIVDGEGSPAPSAWRFPSLTGVIAFALRRNGPPWIQSRVEVTTPVDVLSGAALLVRRGTFVDELDGFDPEFFMFSEDADLCRRLADRGLRRLLVPAATASHIGQASTAGHERRRDVEQWRSRSTYWRKHHSALERVAIRGVYAVAYAVGALTALVREPARRSARDRSRRLWFLTAAALRTPPGPGLAELAADWRPDRLRR